MHGVLQLLLLRELLRLRNGRCRPCRGRWHLMLVKRTLLLHVLCLRVLRPHLLRHLALQLLLVVLLQQKQLALLGCLLLLLRGLLLQGVLGCLMLLRHGLRSYGCTHGEASAVTERDELVDKDQVPRLRLLRRGCGCICRCGCCCCCKGKGCRGCCCRCCCCCRLGRARRRACTGTRAVVLLLVRLAADALLIRAMPVTRLGSSFALVRRTTSGA